MQRFLDRVRKTPTCWLWTGPGDPYGRFYYQGSADYAHRVAYQLFVGPIPEGKHVLHNCDVFLCVRPSHLFVGSVADNMRDRDLMRHMHGENHTSAKLTEDQVRAIRNDSRGNTAIGRDYGVTDATVYQIKKRRIWKHLT